MKEYFRNLKDFAVPKTKKFPNAEMRNLNMYQPYWRW